MKIKRRPLANADSMRDSRGENKSDTGSEHTKREILNELRQRLQLALASPHNAEPHSSSPSQRTPDVVVLVDSHVLLFEPQNPRATEWLHHRCNLTLENPQARDRIQVHPCEWQKIVGELQQAGFHVLY